MRDIRYIVVHCSDTPDHKEFTGDDIRKWHTRPKPFGNGWSRIGYHKVVQRDGSVEDTLTDRTMGIHVKGHNNNSLAICWIGRKFIGHWQYESLVFECVAWCRKYQISSKSILGHAELNNKKTCPNLDMDMLREDVRQILGNWR